MAAAIMAAATTISDSCSADWGQAQSLAACSLSHDIIMISHDITATRTLAGAIPDIVPIGPTTIRFSLTTARGASALVLINGIA
jgi:hypothetical protein